MLPRLISLLVFGCIALASSSLAQSDPNWTRPFPPFRIIGNIYWVGSYDLATYLITTPQGNILINTGVGDTAKQIKASVEQLGFKLADTKILTATHGHFDHVAGMAELKRMTGARLDRLGTGQGTVRVRRASWTSASATRPGPASSRSKSMARSRTATPSRSAGPSSPRTTIPAIRRARRASR